MKHFAAPLFPLNIVFLPPLLKNNPEKRSKAYRFSGFIFLIHSIFFLCRIQLTTPISTRASTIGNQKNWASGRPSTFMP